ncbi:MAG: M24 family metallopeptidase [Phycisphaerales bacterium]|nr:M24 family metallopeptidase [Phycisphaerales bacterium]
MNTKEQRLADFCACRGVDGVHLRRRANIAWLTDGADTHIDLSDRRGIAELVWTRGRGLVLTDNIESPRLATEEFGADWTVHATNWWEFRDGSKVKGLSLISDWPEDEIATLRWSLTDLEIERVRTLGRESAGVLEGVMRAVPAGAVEGGGWSEHRLAGEVIGALRARNIHAPVMLVASDERLTQFRHPIPTQKPIRRIVMAAICAQRHGLTVSATRIVSFGPIDVDRRRRHEAVCEVDRALHARTRPGVRWCDVLGAAQSVYKETGFADEWKKHHQGGPMGYELREFKATPTETRVAVDRQLVGWNPSITGTKSEDTILIRDREHEIVTATGGWPMLGKGIEARPDILVRSV